MALNARFETLGNGVTPIRNIRQAVPHISEELKPAKDQRQDADLPPDRGANGECNHQKHDQHGDQS